MATFVERKNRRGEVIGIQAKVRRVSHHPQSQTFDTLRQAKKWAGHVETLMDEGAFRVDTTAPDKRVTVQDALNDYANDLEARAGDSGNVSRTRGRLSEDLLSKAVADLTVSDLQAWRNSLIGQVAAATINRLMTPLKAALNRAADMDEGKTIHSRAAWQIGLSSLADAEEARNVVINDAVIEVLISAAHHQGAAFGRFIEVAAVTGSRASQIAALTVGDLIQGDDSRLMMPMSKKGRGVKAVRRQPIPIPTGLANALANAAVGRGMGELLLPRDNGQGFNSSNDFVRPWNRARKAAGLKTEAIAPYTLDEITTYALRHSSIVRQILHGVPLRVVAALHDTSVAMIERNYSRYIAGQADAIARAAMPSFSVVTTFSPPQPSRPPQQGQCPHGHNYEQHPPYITKAGSIVCAECARRRTKANKIRRREAATS